MIYLIGGPPKCGKTTLAKTLSQETGISWVSTDTLQNVVKSYINQDEYVGKFPASEQRGESNDEKFSLNSTMGIIDAYRQQAETVFAAIDMFANSEITDGNDFIIEGYHIEPVFVAKLNENYPGKIKSIFLIKLDREKFVQDIKKSTTPNDWIIARTKDEKTYSKIADMVCEYGKVFKQESEKHNLKVLNMDNDFNNQINTGIEFLKK